ncbi:MULTISPECIES: peptidoglycan-associated lipoprotein Pal [Pseudophaeobacter]|jgi:peptidoglycan-associated lipoprotein|uniref:peptidoglycan-associated lipoprotein Pal n=1 Tax=Pseudophaeobacter TaxID=1541822 RepID=UPI002432AB38|nr:peptidoglycan-associated lipoprotein Pal [Pseudophaeobacter profundi]
MSGFKKAFVLVAALGLAACSNTSWNDAGAGGAGGSGTAGSNLDPASPAYFQETIGDRVLFLIDQSTLNPEAEAILQGQARWLTSNSDYVVTIQGHADEQGTREYNLALGARRANSAREYLISQGVAGSRIQVVSYGKERPLEICSAESCYAKNRRAVTVLAGGLTG